MPIVENELLLDHRSAYLPPSQNLIVRGHHQSTPLELWSDYLPGGVGVKEKEERRKVEVTAKRVPFPNWAAYHVRRLTHLI